MTNQFDIREFNKLYEKKIQEKKDLHEIKNRNIVRDNNNKDNTKYLYDLSIGEIFINFKNVLFEIFDDLQSFNSLKSFISIFIKKQSFKNFLSVFIKKNRSFYTGLLLILISLTIYFISEIFFIYKPEQIIYNIIPNDASKIYDNNVYYNQLKHFNGVT